MLSLKTYCRTGMAFVRLSMGDHPQSQGAVERGNQEIENMIRVLQKTKKNMSMVKIASTNNV